MFTQYPKRLLLLLFVIPACGLFTPSGLPSVALAKSGVSAVTFSQQFDLPIPSSEAAGSDNGWGDMNDAVIDVDRNILIADLDIAVTLTHGSFFDLEVVLESPAGTTITLVPGLNDAFIIRGPDGRFVSAGGSNCFLFDDESAVGIQDASPPFDRAFRPASGFELSAFDGQDAFGQWRLQIRDVLEGHTGRLERVDLFISTPEPTSALLFLLGVAWLGRRVR